MPHRNAVHGALSLLLAPALLAACATAEPEEEDFAVAEPSCEGYPEGAVEPMALGEVLSPYRWPRAIHRGTGVDTELDLADVPCNTAEDIDWSPFDVLLFVSIPAW